VRWIATQVKMMFKLPRAVRISWHNAWIAERRQNKGDKDNPRHYPAADPQ
jgi:hypothetical protein